MGGQFKVAPGGVEANGIARWDGNNWHALGSGLQDIGIGNVSAMVWDGVNGQLLIGGEFRIAGLDGVQYVAAWDPESGSWSELGLGNELKTAVKTMVWDDVQETLYVASSIQAQSGDPDYGVIAWRKDSNAWSIVDSIRGSGINALAWDSQASRLFVAGNFSLSGASYLKQIASWDGSAWSTLGVLTSIIAPTSLAWSDAHQRLAVGGEGMTIPNTEVSGANAAVWENGSWNSAPTHTSGRVVVLEWGESDTGPSLFASGSFQSAAGRFIAMGKEVCDESEEDCDKKKYVWTPLGEGLNTLARALLWDVDKETGQAGLIVGGDFTKLGGAAFKPADRLASWDGTEWTNLGGSTNGAINAMAWYKSPYEPDGSLYVGGSFTWIGGAEANHVARWNKGTWEPLANGLNGNVTSLILGAGEGLYAAGSFVGKVSEWSGTEWASLGGGFFGSADNINALAWDDDDQVLFVGGKFSNGGMKNMARWHDNSWSALGEGLPATVRALAWDSNGKRLFASNSSSSNPIHVFQFGAWETLPGLVNGVQDVSTLAWNSQDKYLYIGGQMTSMNHVAAWDVENCAWIMLSGGLQKPVLTLLWDDRASKLYAGSGGIDGTNSGRVSSWDGREWRVLRDGLYGTPGALAINADGSELFVAHPARDSQSRILKYTDTDPNTNLFHDGFEGTLVNLCQQPRVPVDWGLTE